MFRHVCEERKWSLKLNLDGSQSICPEQDRPGLLSVKKVVRWLERRGALGINFTL
jgi:hypothetical protein